MNLGIAFLFIALLAVIIARQEWRINKLEKMLRVSDQKSVGRESP